MTTTEPPRDATIDELDRAIVHLSARLNASQHDLLRRALAARDGSCRFPGCRRERFLEAHHVVHWANGGETSLENCLLLCLPHHRLCHEGGFRIEKDYLGNWFFLRPDGRAVPPSGYCPEDMLDEDVHASAEGLANPSAEGFFADVPYHTSAEGWRMLARRLAAAAPP